MLEKYSRNESDRLEIFEKLHEKVSNEYSEQTMYGNVYNAHIEFLMSNKTIKATAKENDCRGLEMLKSGLVNAFDEAISYLKPLQKNYE